MKKVLIGLLAAASVVGLSACGDDNQQLDDAPVGKIDAKPWFVITNTDQFPNIGVRCYGKNGLYTTTRDYNALTIVVNDPECGGTGASEVVK